MRWTVVTLVLIFCGLGIWAVLHQLIAAAKAKTMPKYDWYASNSAPRGCPMDVAEGSAFLLHDGSSLYVPPATIWS